MENGSSRSEKKRKGSSLVIEGSSKKMAKEEGEMMILDDFEKELCATTSKSVSFLARLIDMGCKTASDYGENLCHLASLANLASDAKAVDELIKLGIVKKLGAHFMVKNLRIQEKVAGIFRNMSISGGHNACMSMIEDGIVTQSGLALKEDIKQLRFFLDQNDGDNLIQISCCIKQIVSLLWNLCETSDVAVNAFNKENIIASILEIFLLVKDDCELLLTMVQCLCTVSEENENAINEIANSKPTLVKMMHLLNCYGKSMKELLIALNISGVFLNIRERIKDIFCVEIMEKIMIMISYTLDKCLLKDLTLECRDSKMLDDCHHLLSAKQCCFELLTNLLCSDDDVETMEVSDYDDDDDSLHDYTRIDENGVNNREDAQDNFQSKIGEFIIKNDLPHKAANCFSYTEMPEMQTLKQNSNTEHIYQDLVRVQKTAIVCLSNIIDMKAVHDVTFLEILWSTITRKLSAKFADSEREMWTELTGCLRAIANAINENNLEKIFTNDVFQYLENWYLSTKNEDEKCNLLKIFGIAGKFYSQKEDGEHYLEKIANVLMRELTPQNSTMMLTETLDTVFDAFGEDGVCDKVLSSSGLGQLLCRAPSMLKTKVKSDKQMTNQCKQLVQSTRMNLNRFISYKKLKR